MCNAYRMTQERTYHLAQCAAGCAYHSTVGGACQFCGGPLTAAAPMTRAQVRDALLHEPDGCYVAGKSATLAWLAPRR